MEESKAIEILKTAWDIKILFPRLQLQSVKH